MDIQYSHQVLFIEEVVISSNLYHLCVDMYIHFWDIYPALLVLILVFMLPWDYVCDASRFVFFFRIGLTIQSLLYFHWIVEFLFCFYKECHWYFHGYEIYK